MAGVSGNLARRAGGAGREASVEFSASGDRPLPEAIPASAPAAYYEGVAAIIAITGRFSGEDWNAPTPCTEWNATDLAGHLRCVVDDYHEYLDDAPVSRLARLMAAETDADMIAQKLARQNAAELAALPDAPPAEHIASFARAARRYMARLEPLLGLPHHSYRGRVVTVAGMAGLACVEWHVHAWDLATAAGQEYRPADPEAVLAGWLIGLPYLPVDVGGDPWLSVLRAAGRLPRLAAPVERRMGNMWRTECRFRRFSAFSAGDDTGALARGA
jgi:uncharacterized protein (TIGR03083 family)